MVPLVAGLRAAGIAPLRAALPALLCAALCACAPHDIYRPVLARCVSATPDVSCAGNALQEYADPSVPQGSYLLGFVELDDQGQFHRRAQMHFVVDSLFEEVAANDAIIVVFVHGWKHSAASAPEDSNVATFRDLLLRVSELESYMAARSGQQERLIAGVYVGWRGESLTPPVIRQLSFWNRKATAHRVGNGGVTELLGRLEQVRRTRTATHAEDPRETRLVVIGHSFGGAVVYSAVSQTLVDRFVTSDCRDGGGAAGDHGPPAPATALCDVSGFGDLVVLVNPAFEALRVSALSDMANERRRYFPSQLPVLAVLTSESDQATRLAFPAGRLFSTALEKHRTVPRVNPVDGSQQQIDQRSANLTAVGHFEPYRTHELRPSAAGMGAPGMRSSMDVFLRASNDWAVDRPGSEIDFDGTTLIRGGSSVGRNPYLFVRVDGELIDGHNDLSDPRVADFVRQLILISSQSDDPEMRRMTRTRMMQAPP